MSFRGERKRLDLGKYSLVTFESDGKKFEIIVDPRTALKYYRGEAKPEDTIVLMDVFYDAQKGTRATIDDLKRIVLKGAIEEKREKVGRSLSKDEIEELKSMIEDLDEDLLKEYAAKIILKRGELKLPKDLRDELLERKVKQIIAYIQKYAINPATKAPYPPQKIREALDLILSGQKIGDKKIRIFLDPLRDYEEEIPAIIDALKAIMPIRLEIIIAKIMVPPQYTGVAYSYMEKYGSVKESTWHDDGTLEVKLEVPGGQFMQFHRKMLDLTKGTLKLEVLERKVIG